MTANECEADGPDILKTNSKSEPEHHHRHDQHEKEASTEASTKAEAIEETPSSTSPTSSPDIPVGGSTISVTSTNEQAETNKTTEDSDEMRLRKREQQQQQQPQQPHKEDPLVEKTADPTDSPTAAPKSKRIFGGIFQSGLLSKIGKAFGHHHHHRDHPASTAQEPVHCKDKLAQKVHQQHLASLRARHRRDVLLFHCSTIDEHCEYIYQTIEKSRSLQGGSEGLRQLGFEFKVVSDFNDDHDHDDHDDHDDVISGDTAEQQPEDGTSTTTTTSLEGADNETKKSQPIMSPSTTAAPARENDRSSLLHASTHSLLTGDDSDVSSMRRLFHIESNTMITMDNRQKFIADGDMYDAIARFCQKDAQSEMIKEGNLEWITLHEAGNNSEPVQALVSAAISKNKEHLTLDQQPTLLIATGKGKVRAGVFSRQHLMTSGMECSTALPLVREAIKRNMNIIMLDPNVHGDRMGMVTFEKSMSKLFQRWETSSNDVTSPKPAFEARDLFVLSHSQSGAQLARYLLEKSEHYLPHIRAIAFTDSTHNIQWTRNNEDLRDLLQGDRCIYYKSTAGDACDCESVHEPLETAGQEIETDSFWKHRFGSISTRCAGTSEHALTNWFVRSQIWKHFDGYMQKGQVNASSETPQ